MGWLLPQERKNTILGDLREEYHLHAERRLPGYGLVWYVTVGMSIVGYYAIHLLASSDGLAWDLRVAWRRLVRSRRFALAAVGGIGIGATASIVGLSVAHRVFVTPLPFPEASRLGLVTYDFSGSITDGFGLAYRDLLAMRKEVALLDRVVAVMDGTHVDLTGDRGTQRLAASFIGPGYIDLLGIDPLVGRTFNAQDHRVRTNPPVIVSETFWRRELGAEPTIVGRSLVFDGVEARIIGVLSDARYDIRQRHGRMADVYLPLNAGTALKGIAYEDERGEGPFHALVRLRGDVTLDEVDDQLSALSDSLATIHPRTNEGWSFDLESLDGAFYSDLRAPATIFLGGAGLLFLLVTLDLTGLVLVRRLGQRHGDSIQRILGAGHARVLRLRLAEAVILATGGAALGLFGGWLAVTVIPSPGLLSLPTFAPVRITGEAVCLTLLLLAGLALLLGLAGFSPGDDPSPPNSWLRSSDRHAIGRGKSRVRSALVVGEIGVAFAFLVFAGLLVRNLDALQSADLGFEPDRVLTYRVELDSDRYPSDESLREAARGLIRTTDGVAGVEDAFLWSPNQLGQGSWVDLVTREGRWDRHASERLEASRHHVLPGALGQAGIEIVQGRDFTGTDRAGSDPVALVSESLARRLWPGESALGRSLESRVRGELVIRRIVGVVEDARHRTHLRAPLASELDVYYAFDQRPERRISIAARLEHDATPGAVAEELRASIREIDPTLPFFGTGTVHGRLRAEEAEVRAATVGVVGYALLAGLLASLGLYGIMAENVRGRAHEIGLRIALGARGSEVLGSVALGGLIPLVPGAAVGLALLLATGSVLDTLLYRVPVWDPVVLASATLVLVLVGMAASIGPGLRAARIDPARTLREG